MKGYINEIFEYGDKKYKLVEPRLYTIMVSDGWQPIPLCRQCIFYKTDDCFSIQLEFDGCETEGYGHIVFEEVRDEKTRVT